MKQTLFILLMGCSLIQLHAQEDFFIMVYIIKNI